VYLLVLKTDVRPHEPLYQRPQLYGAPFVAFSLNCIQILQNMCILVLFIWYSLFGAKINSTVHCKGLLHSNTCVLI